jgi:serine/threonine protein kinase
MSIIGKTLNQRFHILEPLAQGGFGHTYLAEDLTFNSRQKCVVKHLSPSKENLPHLARIKDLFEREADTLAKLSLYSNLIPKLIDRFEQAGELYLVQEFIEGAPLSAELTPGKRFTAEATIELLLQILMPLDYCHRENLLHRDLKPANIMRRRQTGELVLIDFGLAKDIGASITHKSYGGTPGYAPEEQQHGYPVLASDVYAVGMIAIQAFTGMSPSEFQRNPQTMEWEWSQNFYISDKNFAALLNKMIHPFVDGRYQSAQDVLVDIPYVQYYQDKPYWPLGSTQYLVKSNVKGKMPSQMREDQIAFDKFIETLPTDDQKSRKSNQMGMIDDLTVTFVYRKYLGLKPKYLPGIEIDFYLIEESYQRINTNLRYLAPEMMDIFFPNSRNICMYNDCMNGLIPITEARLNRLKDIYNLVTNHDWHTSELFLSLNNDLKRKLSCRISETTREFREKYQFGCIPDLLEIVYSDAGENDFYLFSDRYWYDLELIKNRLK